MRPSSSNIAPHPRRSARPGFTLIELLVVMAVIVILAGILVPTITAARRNAKIVSTRNLITQIEGAIERYSESLGAYPPDKIDGGARLVIFTDLLDETEANRTFAPATCQSSAEALFYYLANPNLSGSHPYLELQTGKQTSDLNNNGVAEIL
ncbi:type II secretion system protein, partial [bacterium]|nr:type II secretion system protein [bacterium]